MPGMLFVESFLISFYRCGSLAFSDLGGFFIKFPAMYLCKGTCLFTGTFESPQGDVEGFVLSYFNRWHPGSIPHFVIMGKKGEF